jgi:uncharacterized membrane-anchored protein
MKSDNNHELLSFIDREIHSRPAIEVSSPALIYHFCFVIGANASTDTERHIETICSQYGLAPLEEGDRQIIRQVTDGTLKWERHNEFETFTYAKTGPDACSRKPKAPDELLESIKAHPLPKLVATRLLSF